MTGLQMINLVIAGHVCIDKNTVNGVTHEDWGSSAMYINNYFKNDHSIRVKIISPYGDDFSGYSRTANIVNRKTDSKTLIYKNAVDNSVRKQWCYNSKEITLPHISSKVEAALKVANVFILAPMTPVFDVQYVSNLLNKLSDNCLRVLLPQGYFRHIDDSNKVMKRSFVESSELIQRFHLVIMSEEDTEDSSSIANRWSTDNTHVTVVVTRADKGATYYHSGKELNVMTEPIPDSEIANPVGGGDVFSGILAVEFLMNSSIQYAVRLANQRTADYLRNT